MEPTLGAKFIQAALSRMGGMPQTGGVCAICMCGPDCGQSGGGLHLQFESGEGIVGACKFG